MTDDPLFELNKGPFLGNFPAERRWSQVTGLLFQHQPQYNPSPLVSIGALDQQGQPTTVWMSLDNAVYLATQVMTIARQQGVGPRSSPADPTPPHSI